MTEAQGPQSTPAFDASGTPPPAPAPTVSWGAPTPPTSSSGFNWGDFFAFRYMITPALIRVLYILGVVLITLGSIGSMSSGFGFGYGGGVIGGLLFFLLGNLYLRVVMELMVVFFGMHESLRSIERQGRR